MDIVPREGDVEELLGCKETHCYYPHKISAIQEDMQDKLEIWTSGKPFGFLYSLSFAKFTPEAQAAAPREEWYHRENWMTLDRLIEKPLIRRTGREMHLHPRMIEHNHASPKTWEEKLREVGYIP